MPEIAAKLWGFPMIYLNPVEVLHGDFLATDSRGTIVTGMLVLVVWSLAIILLLSYLFRNAVYRRESQR
ncbi:hypothetical protein [Vagococcus acidifermentans]|uniref:hypothetical protein n=1 Tax=Vagococcus acidifermentans TaxID=564710 RepID=UPI0014778170|nr:hypothetical protein [Vagococcus acidifermentans]